MYGQGNYAPQFRHGPSTPPPALPPFQQGPPAPPPPVIQQGLSTPPNHVVQPAPPPVYQHGPPPPPPLPLVQQGPPIQVPPPGVVNTGQPYVHPQPSVYGSSQMAHSFSTVQQNSQYPSTVSTQNIHHVSSVHAPGPPFSGLSHTEMIWAPLHPRVLPPPPSQGKMFFRTPLHPPGAQGLQHIRTLPPPPPSSFVSVTPAPFAPFVHGPVEDAYPPSMPPPPPPPLPSSPPPLPPSPPPLASPPKVYARSSEVSSGLPLDAISDMSHHTESGLVYDKPTESTKRFIDSFDRLVGPTQTTEDVPTHDDYPDVEGGTRCEMESLVEDGLLFKEQTTLDLSPPPPKPAGEVIRKIEVLCQFISKNGPNFEDMAREKELGNPEFAFLIGGEPGSDAAIAYDYFQWMKNKSLSEYKLCNVPRKSDSLLRPWEIKSSMQSSLTDDGASHSPADSDMDMEDDVSQSDKDQDVSHSIEDLNRDPVSKCNEFIVVKEQLHAQHCSTEHPADELSGIVSCSGPSELAKQEKECDRTTFGRSFTKDYAPGMHSAGAAECALSGCVKKSTSPGFEDLSPSRASLVAAGISSKESFIKGGSPFRLIQGYASDDSAGDDDDGPCLEDVSPVRVSVADGTTGLPEDMGTDLDMNVGSRNVSVTVKGFMSLRESTVIASDALDSSTKTDEFGINNHGKQMCSDPASSCEVFGHEILLQGDVDIPNNVKLQKEDAKQASPQKVDGFGRLVREGGSESDFDGPCYSGNRSKRSRNWSWSRSPQDERRKSRSPWRRKERQSRSHSFSPKKQRSRSESPTFRCMGDEIKIHDVQPCQDVPVSSTDAPKEGELDEITESASVRDNVQPIISSEVGRSTITLTGEVGQSDSSEEAITQMLETRKFQVKEEPTGQPLDSENLQHAVETHTALPIDRFLKQPATDAENQNLRGETSHYEPSSSEENSVVQLPQANVSLLQAVPVIENADHHPMNEPDPTKVPSTQPYPDPSFVDQPRTESFAPQPLAPREFPPPNFPDGGYQFQSPHLPPPPPLPRDINAPHMSQQPKDYNLPPTGSDFHSQSALVDRFPPYQAPVQEQHSHFPGLQKPSWTSLPPSYVNELTPSPAMHTHGFRPGQFPQNPLYPKNDFPQALTRLYPPEEHTHSQVFEFHPRPPLPMEDFRLKHLPVDNLWDQPFGGPSFVREERFTHPAMPEGNHLHLTPQQDSYLHFRPQLREEHHFPLPIRDNVQNFQALQNQRFTSQFQVQGLTTSSSIAPASMHSQSVPLPMESPAKQTDSFPGNKMPPRSFSKEDFGTMSRGNIAYPQQQQPSYGLQPSATDGFSSCLRAPGKVDSAIARYSSSFLDSNPLSLLSDAGGSKISNTTHYNPFASTFEQQPGALKFSSSVHRREIDTIYSGKFDSYGLSRASVDGQGVDVLGSRQAASPPESSRPGEQILPRSIGSLVVAASAEVNDHAHPQEVSAEGFLGTSSQFVRESTAGDQYDPLFDSIEPSSNMFRKFDHVQERNLTSDVDSRPVTTRVAYDSDIMLRLTGSHKPLDVEENNRQKEPATAAVPKSPENDEFGETAEVGAVENASPQPGEGKNWSPGNQKIAMGDIEIDQVQTPGKSKKGKDSRSMKLFKIALADFVKEVLKPSWRHGNMSKEAFKTIVKKTVDKVSGAMKSHQIPKSQAKINQFVESSQRKLTKLVMGYVDKYVKV